MKKKSSDIQQKLPIEAQSKQLMRSILWKKSAMIPFDVHLSTEKADKNVQWNRKFSPSIIIKFRVGSFLNREKIFMMQWKDLESKNTVYFLIVRQLLVVRQI